MSNYQKTVIQGQTIINNYYFNENKEVRKENLLFYLINYFFVVPPQLTQLVLEQFQLLIFACLADNLSID